MDRRERTSRWVRLVLLFGVMLFFFLPMMGCAEGAAEAKTPEEINAFYTIGKRYLDAGDFEKALKALAQIPGHADADELHAIAKASFLEALFANLDGLEAAKQYSDALALLDAADATLGGDMQLTLRRVDIGTAYKQEFLAACDQLVLQADYEGALMALLKAEQLLGEDMELTAKRSLIKGKMRDQVLAQADELVAQQQYQAALKLLGLARTELGEDALLTHQIIQIQGMIDSENAREIASQLAQFQASHDTAGAIAYLRGVRNKDQATEATLVQLEADYQQEMLKQATEAYTAEGYAGAVSVLQKALQVLPRDEELKAQLQKYRAMAPVWLDSLNYLTYHATYYQKSNVTNLGTTLTHVLERDGFGSGPYEVVYAINGQYERFTGFFSVKYDNRSTTQQGRFQVYADDSIIYTSPMLTGGMDPLWFDINIAGCQTLKIVLDWDNYYDFINYRCCFFLGELQLHPVHEK